MEDNNLPEVPKKLSLWQRLNSTAYEDAINVAADYRAKLEEAMERVSNAREEVDKRKRELDEREAEIAKQLIELAEKEASLKEREFAINGRENEVAKKEKEAAKTIDLFRQKEEIEPEVPTKSLERDEIIKTAISSIKERSEKLLEISKKMQLGRATESQRNELLNKKGELRAALLATVCLYRDSLSDDDRLVFNIDGDTAAIFLQEQAIRISKETGQNENAKMILVNEENKSISENALRIIDSTYKEIAKKLDVTAGLAYESAAYAPFHGNLGLTDNRNAGVNVFANCLKGENVGLKLYEGYANSPRSTINVNETTSLEEEINNVNKNIKDFDR